MKVIIVVDREPVQRYMVRLYSKGLIDEVKALINRAKHSEAAAIAFTKGSFEGEVFQDELPSIKADLILSRDAARWDLMK